MSNEIKYRGDIQVLRGLAVMAVVLFHAEEKFFPLGYLGVDVFFVISGFVVTPLILRIFTEQSIGGRLSNLRYFYKRRFYRLAPALSVTLAISAIAILLLGYPADHQRFARQGIATLLLMGNLGAYVYSGDYFSPDPNPLVHTWSLSVEEQIYIFLPLILMLIVPNRTKIKKIVIMALLTITSISLLTFLVPAILQPIYSKIGIADSESLFSFYSPINRIWQFTLGGLAYFYQIDITNQKYLKRLNLVTGLVLILVLFMPLTMNLRSGSFLASWIAVVVIILRSLDLLPNFLSSKLEWLGDRSYSIYLAHMPLLYLAKYSPTTQIGNGENRIAQSITAVIASILLGSISYSKIENRFRDRGKRQATSLKTIAVSIALTILAPLAIFIVMDRGATHQYWGLARNVPQLAAYAGSLDTKCQRDSETGPPCIYTNVGAARTVLLIGDSHAGHISQAVIDAAKNENWNVVVWTHGGCHVQFQQSVGYWPVSDNCLNINKQMKAWVLQNKPNTIIVSQFVRSDSSQSDLRNALSTLRLIVPNILLIENNPIFPDRKDFMVPRPLIMRSPYKPPKIFSISNMEIKDLHASVELAIWAKGEGILTMNFTPLFCNDTICTRYANAEWLYFDINHFSVAGAALTVPQLRTYLRSISNI